MNNVIKQIKRCFTIYSALLITLITTRIRGHQTGSCGQDQLVQCAKPISVFTDSGLTFATSKADLEKICPDLKAALKCIHSYTRMCMNLQHRKHFRELFHSTGVMVHELCNNSTYQEEYLKYAPCMKEVAAENEVCFSRYSTAMTSISSNAPQIQNESEPNSIFQKKKREAADEGIKSVCCTFREYVDCSTHTMRRACGEDAALFSRNFLDRMSSSMIKLHCSSYGSRQCGLGSGAGLSATRASLVSVAASAVLALLLRFSMS